jgi:hypothetical protein
MSESVFMQIFWENTNFLLEPQNAQPALSGNADSGFGCSVYSKTL